MPQDPNDEPAEKLLESVREEKEKLGKDNYYINKDLFNLLAKGNISGHVKKNTKMDI